MVIIGIDPGPTHCGYVSYHPAQRGVSQANSAMPVEDVLSALRLIGASMIGVHVAIERVQSYGISGGSLLLTAEVVGRLWQRATDSGLPVSLHYRRDVLRGLDVAGKGNRDALVRARCVEILAGGELKVARGTKAHPGPCYGVSSHAWSALAVALTAADFVSPKTGENP